MPGENDSDADLTALIDWAASVSPDLPLHLSAYHPAYRFSAPATPPAALQRAYRMARQRLAHVYVGNAPVEGTSDTVCPQCGHTAISRTGYHTRIAAMTPEGRCANCDAYLNIVT